MKKNFAFTMPELLVVFVIMSLLLVFSLYTINDRYTDFFTRYYTAYDALNKAVYNTYTDTYCRIEGGKTKTDCSSSQYGKGRDFPTKAGDLCERLKEYLNATPDSKCDNKKYIANNATTNYIEDSEFYDKNNKPTKNLQLSLTNGFKLYFSNLQSTDLPHGNSTIKNYKYFIVYVDLNGDSKPNSFKLPHPDIVPFIVTIYGDVIPVGYPVFDKTYASARVVDELGNQTKSYTIDEARQIAFGKKTYKDIPISLEPYFNRVHSKLIPAGTPPSAIYYIGNPDGPEHNNQLECKEGTFNCMFKIDENLERRH